MAHAERIQSGLNSYLKPILQDYQERIVCHTQPKILRDVIWGFNSFNPYELAIIDSPPFQRLRDILQTSLAFLTYPCAVHTRFEHSLGVAAVAARMLNAINERKKGCVDPKMAVEVRLAALLHDLGHGPFSHGSEKFYGRLTDENGGSIFESLKTENRMFAEASPSEIITFLLVTTASFKQLWSVISDSYSSSVPELRDVNLDRVASMIVGSDDLVGEGGRFYRQIINGPFDADKLDYLPRDGYFTGLEIVVDIERLLKTVTVITENSISDIAVVISGASVLEQVIFSKTQLYASMYHHHKVRAAHQLLMRLFQTILEREYKPAGRNLKDPISYIMLDDSDFLRSDYDDAKVDSIVRMIKRRILPQRALVVSYPCFGR
ncbi:MAG: HD domain-containing protein, partial [Nitrospinota bacterium]